MRKRALARAAQNQGYAPRQTGSVRARTVSAIAPPEPSRRECRSPQAVRKIIRAAKPVRFRHPKAPVVPFAFPFQALSRARRRGMGCARTAAGPAPGPLSLSLSKAARRRPGWLSGALGWPNRVAFDKLRLSGSGAGRDGWAIRMHRNRTNLTMTRAWRWGGPNTKGPRSAHRSQARRPGPDPGPRFWHLGGPAEEGSKPQTPFSLSLSKPVLSFAEGATRPRPGWLSGAPGQPNHAAFDKLRLSGVSDDSNLLTPNPHPSSPRDDIVYPPHHLPKCDGPKADRRIPRRGA